MARIQTTIIDEKLIFTIKLLVTTHLTDVDIQPTIAIDIDHADSGSPVAGPGYSRLPGDIFKPDLTGIVYSPVEKQTVGQLIGGKINIGKSVIIDITNGNAASIIKIEILNDVESIVLLEDIAEGYAGLTGIQ